MLSDFLVDLIPPYVAEDRIGRSNRNWKIDTSSLGRYVFGSEISYNKAPPRLPGLGC